MASRPPLAKYRAICEAAAGIGGADLLICPPATLSQAAAQASAGRIAIGGQDCHAKASAAPIPATFPRNNVKDAGAAYVIVGHSERRADHGESDALVRAKAEAALRAGLTAIVCVGETQLRARGRADAGDGRRPDRGLAAAWRDGRKPGRRL